MSKYEELKKRLDSAQAVYSPRFCEEEKPTAVRNALDELRDYERGAAELIERARDELKKWCEDFCKNTPCSDCQTRKLIDEIETLMKGGRS